MGIANWPGSAAIRKGVLLACALVACAIGASAAQAAVGVQDFSYADASPINPHQPTAPTGEKPQSKLWFNDGIWWGSIWSKTKYTIQRYDVSGTWVDTGVTIDPRDKSQADMLWDGTHLYAISNVHEASSTLDPAVRLYRFSYNAATKSYTSDWANPVIIFQPSSTSDLETVAIDKDSTGVLWATFTYANSPGNCVTPATCPNGRSVYTAHSVVGNDSVWSAPAVLPRRASGQRLGQRRLVDRALRQQDRRDVLGSGARSGHGVSADHQLHRRLLRRPRRRPVRRRLDAGDRAPGQAQASDDHINLKAAPDGRLYAAVKTSSNDAGSPVATDPLIYLLERTTRAPGRRPVQHGGSEETRSQILLDPAHGVIYQFATHPPTGRTRPAAGSTARSRAWSSPSFALGPRDAVHRARRG